MKKKEENGLFVLFGDTLQIKVGPDGKCDLRPPYSKRPSISASSNPSGCSIEDDDDDWGIL